MRRQPEVSVRGSFSETQKHVTGPLPGVLRVSGIERYPDTAARRRVAPGTAGHNVVTFNGLWHGISSAKWRVLWSEYLLVAGWTGNLCAAGVGDSIVMTGAGGATGPDARPGRQWDVALSFAGAQRPYVEQVASALKARGVRCFYDADEQVRLWGTHLAEELPQIYARESAAVVVFISADYAGRDWTRLERRAAFSRAVIEAGVYVLPARFDDSELPGLLPDVVAVDLRRYIPEQFADLVVAKLADLAISPSPLPGGGDGRPAGGIRVREADPRRLGVHAAISVLGVPDEVPPEYVPRDVDAAGSGVRAKVAAAAERGGFVLLVGGSSVGKTRCAVEAVKAVLPDWWLVHPAGPGDVAALAQTSAPRTVVWLDELQRYLDGEHGLTGAVVRALLNHLAVIIGTLWPDRYTAYTALPGSGGADPHAREREVLDLAYVIRIDPEFSPAEQHRARAAAARDQRLAIALESAGYGLTQTLAAAPQLVARWEDARTATPYAWAVLTAALDVARLGARTPLSADFLRAAAPDYCTSQQQAEAPDNWFEQALAYATGKLHGAAAALSPAGAGIMGRVVGYTVADYLIQHASRERRYAFVPAATWDAVLSHIRDAADTARLADSASNRLLYRYAIPLYRHAADADDQYAARRLVTLLFERGDLDGAAQVLRARANAGDEHAARRLADLLASRGDLDGLRVRAGTGDEYAARRLADLLFERRDLDGAKQILHGWADVGDGHAVRRLTESLADLLLESGDLDRAAQVLHAAADAGDEDAAFRLAGLLAQRGDLDGAARILRPRADAGDEDAAFRLAGLLAQRGDLDGLRARAIAGDGYAASRLADLLADRGDLDGLRARADAGDEDAAWWLADLLADRGDLDGLRALADAGDEDAAFRLAGLLAERGDLDGLRALADAGDEDAASRLADLLAQRGDLDGAARILRPRADAGDEDAARWLADLLFERGDLDGLRALADAGDEDAARRLADLLFERGDLDGLRALADADNWYAARRLAGLLAERGDLDGAAQILRPRADAGNRAAARRLAGLLAERGDLDGLRALADAGDEDAASRLADLLGQYGDLDGLRALADAGDGYAARRLAGLLAEQGDLDGAAQILRPRADVGDGYAVWVLVNLLFERGDLDGLRALADADDGYAARVLVNLLFERGDLDGLRALADADNWYAASRLADLLAARGDLDGLGARIGVGDDAAVSWLTALLIEQGRGEEAERLRRFGLNPDGSIAFADTT